ncbi:mannose-1-phosphate guanylyltransferase [Owenweeksia hongkongensis]|uniref:mannose-1-phosphate guanylyltransferase n=1 Tax=Owenweeksia hongkongensis TaxID=253245 RepID=UPI003A93AB1F
MQNIYSVIMAGGIGSRFWPVSTSKLPKQFHDILGTGETLIQQTYRRLRKLSDPDKILVVTHKSYKDLVMEQLPEIPVANIILEPARRNTAPCITYAAYRIKAEDPTATMLVAPSDHLISNEDEFTRIATLACNQAEDTKQLFTLGIKPHRPDTGYGYIQFVDLDEDPKSEVKRVKTFTEKPDGAMAQQFLESGEFLWNSGIFIWSINTYMDELNESLPDLYSAFEAGAGKFGTGEETAFIEEIYPACENESIDYGLMEKSHHVYVVPSDFGWSDLGTWGSLHEHASLDENQNAQIGNRIVTYETKDTLIRVPKNKVAVVQGLEGYVVVDNEDALLICKLDQEQHIKTFVSDLKLKFGDKIT